MKSLMKNGKIILRAAHINSIGIELLELMRKPRYTIIILTIYLVPLGNE